MKTLRIFSLMLIGAIAFSSCEKDDEITTAEALERLQNVWKVDNIKTVFYTPPTEATINYTGQADDYYDFRTDGKLYTQVNGGKDTLLYNLINSTTIVVNNNGSIDTGKITTLTSTKLVGVTKFKINSTDYNEVTANLSR